MKKFLATLLLAVPMVVAAQDQAPALSSQASLKGELKEAAPTYSDIYCAGFITKENIPNSNHILAGLGSPHGSRFAARDTVYLQGSGYVVGNQYAVVRKISDPNKEEQFPGERALLAKSGFEYAELGRIVITHIDKDVAEGVVEFSCQTMMPGDSLVPFHEKEMVKFTPRTAPFERYAPMGATAGRIIEGKEFDQVLGTGQKVYVNIGANKGLHPGDYLRVTRNYDPKDTNPIDAISLNTPYADDTATDVVKLTKADYKKLPYRGLGEIVVLSVTPETATGMITFALEDIQVGDVVEAQAKQ